MITNPLKLAAAASFLALASANAATTVEWSFDQSDAGWTTTAGGFVNHEDGITPADANGSRAHDAGHPVAVLSSPVVNFNLANVSASEPVIQILWKGGRGNQNNSANPADLSAVTSYNGGNTNNQGQKGMGFRNLSTGAYDFVDYSDQQNGDLETKQYTQAELVNGGIDPNADYQLDFFTTDSGGWGWTRLNGVNLDPGAVGAVPEPSSSLLVALSGLAFFLRRRR